jgi:hypothetical protein
MRARVGAVRGLCLGLVAAGLTAGLGAVAGPGAQAALPGPDSASWIALKKSGTTLTDDAGDFTPGHLDLTPSGGTLGTATVFLAADLLHGSFRFHVAALPAGGSGGYVVQFDTDGDTAGWERALRYNPDADTVTIFTAGPNAGVTDAGTLTATVPMTTATATSYAGANGGAHVAFAVPRSRLASAGIVLGDPMVVGTTGQAGAGLDPGALAGIVPPKGDVLGIGKHSGLGAPAWNTLVTDPIAIDSDGDGVPDKDDNCPITPNPGQEDDDKVLEDAYPPTHALDGTEGDGNVCDATPRGQDLIDGDGVGALDDQCGEQYGLLANGCPAQSTTVAVLRYRAKRTKFTGGVRADYDQCEPRRKVTVLRSVKGPDRRIGTVRTRANGSYVLDLDKRARNGKYYAAVDPKWTLGARCFGRKSPKIQVG